MSSGSNSCSIIRGRASLADYIKWADGQIAALLGKTPPPGDGKTPYIADDTELSTVPLAVLEAEMDRITKLVSTDKEIQKQYAALSKKITAETTSLEGIKTKLEDAKGARERLGILQSERAEAYQRAFEALIAEQKVLEDLYAPLVLRLLMAKGSLTKLGFSVERVANAGQWAGEAENGLLDLRRQGRFRGRGSLAELANKDLRKVWETGSALEIRQAMAAFWEEHHKELLEHCPVAQTDPAGMREWLKRFMPWLFSTSHVSLRYGITYDGVDIRKLSPGTRGIVLLLLYLALDEDDDRPLIIDQPEENLDPKSVFDELVGLFVEAKSKRQVIIVTHNANLVINTDADQIIVAEAGPHPAGGLPPITYRAGGLENAEIRKIVCDILEGGERAFKERARRLRVVLER
jgi:hypothetical protein